jgi:murein DD-endopeptidase MepM/ murein hydrolase activator NlpD
MKNLFAFLIGLSGIAPVAIAQQPSIVVEPAEAVPGSIVRLTLGSRAEDSVVAVRGTMAGEPLRFLAADSGRYNAIGAVPTEASDSLSASVLVTRASGAVDSLRVTVVVAHVEVPTTEPRLAVSQQFTRPLDAKTQARIARENELARRVGRAAHDSPPRWTSDFLKPRDSRITSEFGTGRMFNGTVASRHLGVDYAGAVGTEVRAANRGVVALVDTFFLAGRLVYIDHGGGVVTGYFHLSKPLVAKGDTVKRGQVIGLVGATGRVTGPHLHWTARYGALTVNPADLLKLAATEYSGRFVTKSDTLSVPK